MKYEKQIIDILMHKNIKMKQLFKQLGAAYNEKKQRVIRLTIQKMKKKYPIGSSSSCKNGGYFLIRSKDQLKMAQKEMTSRIKSLLKSYNDLNKSFLIFNKKLENTCKKY